MKSVITHLSMVLILTLSTLVVSAQPVSEEEALSKALSFLNTNSEDASWEMKKAPRREPRLKLAQGRPEFFIFNDEANGGYVIVSGDAQAPEVLGYSYSGTFDPDNAPSNMLAWLEGYAEQIRYLQIHKGPSPDTHLVVGDPIEPLIMTKWSQNEPYNLMCPMYNGYRCVTGCVATAMAQVMYYHKWPKETTNVIPAYTTGSTKIQVPEIGITSID